MPHERDSVDETPRVTVVTGSGSGIGRATTELLLRRGSAVIGVDLVEPPEDLGGHDELGWVTGDVAEAETWERVVAACRERDEAGADAFVSCAATIVVSSFLETRPDDWRRLFDVNVLGAVRGMQALLPAMIERRNGAVAVVCSVDSLIVEEEMSAYATSKAALLHATRSAAIEHARDGVRINGVCPGIIDTPLLQRHFDSLDDPAAALRAAERRSPLARIIRPEEIAEVLCFLVGPGASAMSGAAVTVDGGLIATYDFDSAA
jgi:NAD(P)-dependent dehydrogenase (short-subunit alcohol dehydrogenase family)